MAHDFWPVLADTCSVLVVSPLWNVLSLLVFTKSNVLGHCYFLERVGRSSCVRRHPTHWWSALPHIYEWRYDDVLNGAQVCDQDRHMFPEYELGFLFISLQQAEKFVPSWIALRGR